MTLRDVLREALRLVDHEYATIMRPNDDYQIRLAGKGLALVEIRYLDGVPLEWSPWSTFEGFSVEAALADDWRIL